jgi:hypothetical protein
MKNFIKFWAEKQSHFKLFWNYPSNQLTKIRQMKKFNNRYGKGNLILPQIVLLILFAFSFKIASSQDRIVIPKIQGEFRFDGVVDDACWQNVQPFSMVMHTPVYGNQPSDKTEVFLCYDETYLYAGARLFDSEPSKMFVTSKKRDEVSVSNESFTMVFDSFNDKENALGFSTTPAALRRDFTILKDAMGSMPEESFNDSWNTFWDVKTTKNDKGWFVEMRIPLSSMRFKEDNGNVVMGLICIRRIAHRNETDVFPSIPPNWGQNSCYRPSKAQEVVFEGIHSKKPFYIAPYAIGGYQQDYQLNESGTGYTMDENPKFNAGLDVKYGLTNNLTLDLTLNTDFAQVEADDEQINLTRFSLFFPEKRTFFQERSSIFAFDFEPGSSLFYSRRIGMQNGEQVPIYGGARITGMAGKWDIGFMDMQTKSFQPADTILGSLPSENFGILRLRRQVFNENSYLGGIVTSRLGTDGTYNSTFGLDGTIKLFGDDYLNLKWAQMMDNNPKGNSFTTDRSKFYFNWRRYNDKGLSYEFTWAKSGKYFDPKMGFQDRSDYTHLFGGIGYGWIPGETSLLQNHKVDIRTMSFINNLNNKIQSFETDLSYGFKFKSDFNGEISAGHMVEDVAETFWISKDASIPAGKYEFNKIEVHLNSPGSKRLMMGLNLFAGTFFDGSRFSPGIESELKIGSSLQLGLNYDHNYLQFNERDQTFSGGIFSFKAYAMFSTKLLVNTFVQYNSAVNEIISNLRFRYNPKEGNDFYLVFNEGRNTNRNTENPLLPAFNNRTVLLKYTYTFTL